MTQSIKCLPFKHEELGWIFPEPTEDQVLYPCNPRDIEGARVTLGLTAQAHKPNQQALELMTVLPSKKIRWNITEEDSWYSSPDTLPAL